MQRSSLVLRFTCIGLALLAVSCATTPQGGNPPSKTAGLSAKDAEDRMTSYLANGREKILQGNVNEGIQQLVAVLAVKNGADSITKAIEDLSNQAQKELTTIGSALSLDSGTEWLDENKNQIMASVLDVGKPAALQPSIILAYNMGRGRSLVAGAPIVFEFIKGSGTITAYVTTNEYGQANCSVAKLDSQTQEQLIRASLVYRMDGFTYRFQGVEKDFAYVPPTLKATILVMEKSATGPNPTPVILDSVYNTLKGVTFDFSQYDGALLGSDFAKVFAGDPAAIKALGVKKEVSYLVMVLNDCYSAAQIELNGQKYNLYKSQTTATTRIIRVVDGKILYSGQVQGISGQGNAIDKAVLDGYKNAAVEMAAKLQADLKEINAALAPKSK
jgi:hypothetical protein